MKSIANYFLLITTTLLALTACEAADPPGEKPSWNTLWTIDLVERTGSQIGDLSDDVVATLRVPRGALWFPPAQKLDYEHFYAKASSVTMKWHFDTELPYYVWAKQFLPEGVNPSYHLDYKVPDDTFLSFNLGISNPEKDYGKVAFSVYFESRFKAKDPQILPVDEGLVWNGRAHKYSLPYQGEMYKLMDSKPHEPTVINCSSQASYCSLRGGEFTDELRLSFFLIPRHDLENWRIYFAKAKKLVQQSLVESTKRSTQ